MIDEKFFQEFYAFVQKELNVSKDYTLKESLEIFLGFTKIKGIDNFNLYELNEKQIRNIVLALVIAKLIKEEKIEYYMKDGEERIRLKQKRK